jgi:hypothetical protein
MAESYAVETCRLGCLLVGALRGSQRKLRLLLPTCRQPRSVGRLVIVGDSTRCASRQPAIANPKQADTTKSKIRIGSSQSPSQSWMNCKPRENAAIANVAPKQNRAAPYLLIKGRYTGRLRDRIEAVAA